MTDDTGENIELNDAILKLREAEGQINEISDEEAFNEALDALDALQKQRLKKLINQIREENPLQEALGGHEKGAKAQGKREVADRIETLIEDG